MPEPSTLPSRSRPSPTRSRPSKVWLKTLRDALGKANVPATTIDEVVQLQSSLLEFRCAVDRVQTSNDGTVIVTVEPMMEAEELELSDMASEYSFSFPPTDPRYLPEFLRAHTHAMMTELCIQSNTPSSNTIISMTIYSPLHQLSQVSWASGAISG